MFSPFSLFINFCWSSYFNLNIFILFVIIRLPLMLAKVGRTKFYHCDDLEDWNLFWTLFKMTKIPHLLQDENTVIDLYI